MSDNSMVEDGYFTVDELKIINTPNAPQVCRELALKAANLRKESCRLDAYKQPNPDDLFQKAKDYEAAYNTVYFNSQCPDCQNYRSLMIIEPYLIAVNPREILFLAERFKILETMVLFYKHLDMTEIKA